ncbi:MAG: LLM class F420-dependent oxidoreductase [Streptosporangiales bacterium]|nr:LLM class F420-dependent oxidoreductase [Streptosporangiales bacterium]
MSDTTEKQEPALRIGAVFPQTELGGDTGAIRTWATEVERAGYQHALIYDHVVGADPAVHGPWDRPYDVKTTFREPFVLFGYLAALTRLELVTGVIILPQRQTALVAKQAAEVDLLTGGRFRLGVGIGWNHVEYEALGKNFRDRGRRSEEQIELLRRLWTEPSLTFDGKHEQVTGAGISPLPVQRPIPLWIGGQSPRAYERIGRLADGWFPQFGPGPELDEARGIVEAAARDAGRDPAALGLEGRVTYTGDTGSVVSAIEAWRAAGATHISVNTMGAGLSADAHAGVLGEIASAAGLSR